MAAEAKAKMEEFVARRTKMAETKIAQAEAQAVADVRAAAAEAAVAAAEKILDETVKGKVAEDLIAAGHRRREDEIELNLNYLCTVSNATPISLSLVHTTWHFGNGPPRPDSASMKSFGS